MKIFIVTFGSRGDVQPYVALGKGLKEAGHTVTVCTANKFKPFILEHGLDYGYMSSELLKLLDNADVLEIIDNKGGLLTAVKAMIKLTKENKPLNRAMVEDSVRAAEIAQPDLVIYHPKALGGIHIAEQYGVPAVMAVLQPMIVPTTAFPPIGIPALKLSGWYNKMTYGLINMGYNAYAKDLNEVRQSMMGLNKFPKSAGLLKTAKGEPVTVLHGYSRHVLAAPDDWPPQAHVSGYWFLDQHADWQPSADLQTFLAAGDAPVYVGFGSMAGRNPQRTAEIVVAALQQARVRGIIATGWGGLNASNLPETIFRVEHVPHDWLFDRVTVVVHHGGAGTTAAGLRAGKPTIICPFFGDQPFWGKRVFELGVGPPPIPQKKLSVEKLAQAIRTAVTDETMRNKAVVLGQKIRAETGIVNAITVIEGLLAHA